MSCGAAGAEADDIASCPHQYLAEIVGTTYDAVKPGAYKAVGVVAFRGAFLCVGNHLDYDAGSGYGGTCPCPQAVYGNTFGEVV